MSTYLLPLIALVLSFMIGSIPTAFLMGRARGIDIRQFGSGNVGATNAFRVLGKSWGLACLLIDMLKGLVPVMLFTPNLFFQAWHGYASYEWLIGLAAIAGHMFSPFLKFRGGKGVATSLGVVLAIAPWPMLIALATGLVLIWLTGYVSVGSIAGAALLPPLTLILQWGERPWTSVAITFFLALAIVWKHRANIQRLRAGTEKRLFGGPR